MLARMALLAILTPAVAGWTHLGENVVRIADDAETAIAAKDMEIGRYYLRQRNYVGAVNRFKIVVTQFPTSQHVEEALAHATEAYLALGVASEAQAAVAALIRKFPNGHWSAEARDALKAAGLEPADDVKFWIR